MNLVNIHIQTKKEADTGNKLLGERYDDATKLYNLNLQDFCILEKGTKLGKASVSFCAKAEDGSMILLQTTGEIFKTMYHALLGAEGRFQREEEERLAEGN
jgi:hypothetical protein